MKYQGGLQVDERRGALQALRAPLRHLAVLCAAHWVLVLAPSWYMLEVYDRVATTRNGWTLLWLSLAVISLISLLQALEWVRAEMLRGLGEQFEVLLAPRVFRASIESAHERGSGARGPSDLRRLREFATSPAMIGLLDAPGSALLLLMLFISPWLALVAQLAAVLQTLFGLAQDRQCQSRLRQAGQHAEVARAWGEQVSTQAGTFQALGMASAVRAHWLKAQSDSTSAQVQASWTAGRYQAAGRFVQQFIGPALLGLGAWLVLTQQLPGGAGMMIVASILGGRLLAPLVQVVSQWPTLVSARQAWQSLGALLVAHPAADGGMPLPRPRGELKVIALGVRAVLAGQAPISLLDGLQFELAAGDMLVVMGPTGAGKTTLARVLLGLVPAHSGSVRLDGASVQGWNKDELGPSLGYLPQSVELLDGTLAENIGRFGVLDRNRLDEAVAVTGLSEWVASLPLGLDTPVGPGGHDLSTGQRQRVALARAVFGWPSLVVLDEPNASLDAEGDAALDATLAELKRRNCTTVVVSHRASILQRSDKLLVLQDGRAVTFGARDDVLQRLLRAARTAAETPNLARTLANPASSASALTGA